MKMTLPRFGFEEVEIDPNTLIEFPDGLPGLESCKQFKIFHSGDDPLVFWLQSINDPDVVLSLTDPDLLPIFYKIGLTEEEQSTLQIEANDEMQIAVILLRPIESNIRVQSAIQVNFKSPIIINVSKRLALQKPLHDSEFSIHTNLPLVEAPQTEAPSIPGFIEASRMDPVVKGDLHSYA
jgi:flagellar assembly factor FliW